MRKESSEAFQTHNSKELKTTTAESSPFVTDTEVTLACDTLAGKENTASEEAEQEPFTTAQSTEQEANMTKFVCKDTKSAVTSSTQEQFDDVPLDERQTTAESINENTITALATDVSTLSIINSQSEQNSGNPKITSIEKKKKKKKQWDIPVTVFFFFPSLFLSVHVCCYYKLIQLSHTHISLLFVSFPTSIIIFTTFPKHTLHCAIQICSYFLDKVAKFP